VLAINYKVLDIKLKNLIQLCKETGNHKKLSVVSFILTSNILNEIGLKLGIRPRNVKSDEKIYEYMRLINKILIKNLKLSLFYEEDIESIREIESIFLKKKGDLPFHYIKRIFSIYYELRRLEIPNLYESVNDDDFTATTNLNFFAIRSSKNNDNSDRFKPLILNKIREKELYIQKELKNGFKKDIFESAIYLKKFKDSYKNRGTNKIKLQGQLKDSINYQSSLDDVIGYGFIGISIIFFILGIIVVIETFLYPHLTVTFSYLILMFFGPGLLLFLTYWYYFRREGSK
jgi:hypothetical protein